MAHPFLAEKDETGTFQVEGEKKICITKERKKDRLFCRKQHA
jgi:hypothetical protein